jgi:hypothetical protein
MVRLVAAAVGIHVSLFAQAPVVSWSFTGEYTCESGTSEATEKLFLLPDMTWDVAAPFTRSSFHIKRIPVQTRGWRGILLFAGTAIQEFSVEGNTVRLYNVESVETPFSGPVSRRPGLEIIRLERPSALGPRVPDTVMLRTLVQTFEYDPRQEELIEVRPVPLADAPERCRRRPLFSFEVPIHDPRY